MKSKKKHTNQDFEVVDGIGKYMDDDIQRIIEGKQLELGDRELPPFDEYRIYKNIQEAVMREEKRKNRRIRMPLFFKWTVACAIVLLVIGVGYNFYQSRSEANLVYREVCAVRGEKLLVLLPDGSRVWLNADSKLTYPEQFAKYNRNVTLEGEAYFEIAENKKSPFQVLAENVKIQVTGTCFNVKAYASDKVIKTTLDEGSINIGHVQSRRPMQQMLPGQTAVYEKRSNVIKIKTDRYHDDASSWKSNRLIFRNTSLKEVLTTLSRHFDIEITVKNEKIASFTYDFVCKGNDLNYVLEVMQSITPVSFKKISEYTYTVE